MLRAAAAAATACTSERVRCQRILGVIYSSLRALGTTPQAALSEGERTQGLQINFVSKLAFLCRDKSNDEGQGRCSGGCCWLQ